MNSKISHLPLVCNLFCVDVNVKTSTMLQKLAFKSGRVWGINERTVQQTNATRLWFSKTNITYGTREVNPNCPVCSVEHAIGLFCGLGRIKFKNIWITTDDFGKLKTLFEGT